MNAPRSCCSERRRRAGLGRRTGASGRRAVSHTARKVQAGESRIGADASEDVREGASFAAQGPQRSWRASSALLAEVVLLATAAAMAIQCERSAKQWQSAFQTVSLLDKCRLLARFLRASTIACAIKTGFPLARFRKRSRPVPLGGLIQRPVRLSYTSLRRCSTLKTRHLAARNRRAVPSRVPSRCHTLPKTSGLDSS